MRLLLTILPVLALAASCSETDDRGTTGEKPLCTAEAAGTATAAKATELLNAVMKSDSASRGAACAKFKAVLEDGSKAEIPEPPGCRWDDRNSEGNPHFLISLHLTQLKSQARATCDELR